LGEKGMRYFQGKPNYKKEVKNILDSISNNKNVIEDISKIIDPKKGIDNSTAEDIVNMGYIKTQIIKLVDSTNGELDETELKNQLKTILIKSWTPMSNVAIEKVKKDLK
jgi:hypothetical protein